MRSAARPLIRRSAALALALTLGAGCYRSTDAPPAAPPPPAEAPAGPPPVLAWGDGFSYKRLPAVTADGSAVYLPVQDSDGARGNPNFRVVVRDRADAETAKHVVLTVEESDGMLDENGKLAEPEDRVTAANKWLADQHAARRLVPLAPLEVEPGNLEEPASLATGRSVTLEWKPSRVIIKQGGKVLVDRATPASWLAEDKPMYPGSPDMCHNQAFLRRAAIDTARKLAVLVIDYYGTDTCWEPAATHHVVAW